MPQWVLLGFVAQFSVMPLAGAAMAKLWGLGPDLASGLILVGCAPGGTASNLVALIAQADVALSVLMTMASTVAAIVMTPLLTSKLAGSYVEIKAADLVWSTLNVVLLPVTAGLALNSVAPKASKALAKYTPFLSVLFVSAICGAISAANSGAIALKSVGVQLIAAIVSMHSIGFALGYFASKKLGAGESRSRTISIETGMQNSALAVVLAKHFPNPTLSSLPGAFSATAHSVIGSILAAYWRRSPVVAKQRYGVSQRYW
jgi:BASS family bile acid:Na+ symporter